MNITNCGNWWQRDAYYYFTTNLLLIYLPALAVPVIRDCEILPRHPELTLVAESGRQGSFAAEDRQPSPPQGGHQVLFHSARMGDGDTRTEIGQDDHTHPPLSLCATNSLITVSIRQIPVISGSGRVCSQNSIRCLFLPILVLSPLPFTSWASWLPCALTHSLNPPHAFWHRIYHLVNPFIKNRAGCECIFRPSNKGVGISAGLQNSKYNRRIAVETTYLCTSIHSRLLDVQIQTSLNNLIACSEV